MDRAALLTLSCRHLEQAASQEEVAAALTLLAFLAAAMIVRGFENIES